MIEVGQVCVKTAGRDAGTKCVVLGLKEGWADVLGLRKKRKVNVKHLIPTKEKLDPKLGEAEIRKKLGMKAPAVKKEKKPAKQEGVREKIAEVLSGKKEPAKKEVEKKVAKEKKK